MQKKVLYISGNDTQSQKESYQSTLAKSIFYQAQAVIEAKKSGYVYHSYTFLLEWMFWEYPAEFLFIQLSRYVSRWVGSEWYDGFFLAPKYVISLEVGMRHHFLLVSTVLGPRLTAASGVFLHVYQVNVPELGPKRRLCGATCLRVRDFFLVQFGEYFPQKQNGQKPTTVFEADSGRVPFTYGITAEVLTY